MRNFKKLLALVLVLAMSVSFVLPALAKTVDEFADAAASATALASKGNLEEVYALAAQLMVDLNILEGNANDSLGLGDNLTRGQFMVMLYKAKSGGQSIDDTNYAKMPDYFIDTKGEWYYAYANWAGVTGISAGIGDNRFGGWRDISFDEALLLCMKAIGLDTDAENFVYSSATVRSTAYALGMMGDLYPLEAVNVVGQNLIDRATACLLFEYTLFAEQVRYMDNGRRYRTGDSTVWGFGGGAGGQGGENPSWTLASEVFRLVGGVFTVITDGMYFGLPEIANWVADADGINNSGDLGQDRGTLGSGKAIIQRPISWNRTTGEVEEYESYILSEEDTEALGIDLYKVGHKLYLIFRHPDWDWGNTVSAASGHLIWNYHPGQQHRLAIEKFYGEPIWLSTVEEYTDVSEAQANSWNGGMADRVFIDYTNDRDRVKAHWNDYWANNSRKLQTGGNIRKDEWKNAEVRTVSFEGKVEYVFIDNYVVHRIGRMDDWWDKWGGSNPKFMLSRQLTPGAPDNNVDCDWEEWVQGADYNNSNGWRGIALEQLLYGMDEWGWIAGDYIALCPVIGSDYWGEWDSFGWDGDNYYGYFLSKEVLDRETGNVTSVRYDADFYNAGMLVDNGTGSGNLTMDGKTYVMSDSVNSRIKNFNSFDNHNERTIVLWKGQIVEVLRDAIPTQYCVITAAGVELRQSYNSSSAVYYVDIVMEDGTIKTGLELDRIVMSNAAKTQLTSAAALNGGALDNGQFSARPEDNASGTGTNGDPLWFRSHADSSIFSDAIMIEGHVFRYLISGNKVVLYEDNAQAAPTAAVAGSVAAMQNGRFNPTWGTVLGQIPGLTQTEGRLTSDATRVIVKTLDNNGKARYRVYTRNVPGFTVPFGTQLYTESLLGGENGGLGAVQGETGNYVRFAFIDATGSTVSSVWNTHWAVATATGFDVSEDGVRIGQIDAIISGNKSAKLQTIKNEEAGFNALKLLRRGDVFIYDSEDGTPNKITNIRLVDSDALMKGIDNGGYFNIVNAAGDEFVPNVRWGTLGNNYHVGTEHGNDDGGPLANAALKSAVGGALFNVYIFDKNSTVNYSNATETVFVKESYTGDRRNIAAKLAQAIEDLENMEIAGADYTSETQAIDAIFGQIKAILESNGCTMSAAELQDIKDNIDILLGGSFALGTRLADIPAFTIYCHEGSSDGFTGLPGAPIPNAAGVSLASILGDLEEAIETALETPYSKTSTTPGLGEALVGGLDNMEATIDVDLGEKTVTVTLEGDSYTPEPTVSKAAAVLTLWNGTGFDPYVESWGITNGVSYYEYLAISGFLPGTPVSSNGDGGPNPGLWNNDATSGLQTGYSILAINIRPILEALGITGNDSFEIRRLTPTYFKLWSYLTDHNPANVADFLDGAGSIAWTSVADASAYNCNRVALTHDTPNYNVFYFQFKVGTDIFTITIDASGVVAGSPSP